MKEDGQEIIRVPSVRRTGKEKPELPDELSQINPQIILEQNYKYFLEYSKLHEANTILKSELQNLVREKLQLKQVIQRLEKRDNKTTKSEVDDIYTNRKVNFNLIFAAPQEK